MTEEAPNFSFIIDPDNNQSKLGSALDAKLWLFQALYLQVNYVNSPFLLCIVKTPVARMS